MSSDDLKIIQLIDEYFDAREKSIKALVDFFERAKKGEKKAIEQLNIFKVYACIQYFKELNIEITIPNLSKSLKMDEKQLRKYLNSKTMGYLTGGIEKARIESKMIKKGEFGFIRPRKFHRPKSEESEVKLGRRPTLYKVNEDPFAVLIKLFNIRFKSLDEILHRFKEEPQELEKAWKNEVSNPEYVTFLKGYIVYRALKLILKEKDAMLELNNLESEFKAFTEQETEQKILEEKIFNAKKALSTIKIIKEDFYGVFQKIMSEKELLEFLNIEDVKVFIGVILPFIEQVIAYYFTQRIRDRCKYNSIPDGLGLKNQK
jgi:hypothetical protein